MPTRDEAISATARDAYGLGLTWADAWIASARIAAKDEMTGTDLKATWLAIRGAGKELTSMLDREEDPNRYDRLYRHQKHVAIHAEDSPLAHIAGMSTGDVDRHIEAALERYARPQRRS